MNNSYQICVQCENGYYLRDNDCHAGEIQNCDVYETEISCNRCGEKFVPVYAYEGITKCLKIEDRFNCSKLDFYALERGFFKCLECVENQFIINQNQEQIIKTECNLFVPIEFCVEYDIEPRISTSSYECMECDELHYLDNNRCLARLVRPQECIEYDQEKDKCLECEEGFFINTEQTACVTFPDGITNCRIYKSRTQCLSCVTNHFYEDGECQPIEEENRISNCVYYID